MRINRKAHWENIYQTKSFDEVSWYQEKPEISLSFLEELKISKTAKIIDIGGGDSYFADYLLELGFEDITVMDISEAAINRAKARLGIKAQKVKWIVADAADFQPKESYDFWHDRAAFHFLTDDKDVNQYIETASENINPGGHLIIGTFSDQGPKKCSGIEISQYTESGLSDLFQSSFEKIRCFRTDHKTPFDTVQNFVFCIFKRRKG